jgi:hypothetical protein
MYEFVNVNPCKKRLGDCVVRALSLALNQSWYRTAIDLCIEGLIQYAVRTCYAEPLDYGATDDAEDVQKITQICNVNAYRLLNNCS